MSSSSGDPENSEAPLLLGPESPTTSPTSVSSLSDFSAPNAGQNDAELLDSISRPKKIVSRTAALSKKANGTGQRRLKSQRKSSPSSSSSSPSVANSSTSPLATSPVTISSRASAPPQPYNDSRDGSDEDAPFLGDSADRRDDLDGNSRVSDLEIGYEHNDRPNSRCFCVRGLVELLKVASFSYINFALVLVPFPLLVHFAGWNRGILFILSYITLYPITTFLNSIIAASNNFFPSWLSAIFKLFLRNSLPIIIGLFAVHHNMGKFVQGMLVGLIIHRLFLMLGLSITVAASRSKSIRVDEKNVRVAASFLYMAVIIMTLPSIFKLSSPDSGALGLLKISRWSAVFLFFLLLFSLVYSLRTESKFWSATEQMSGQLRIGPITAVVVLVLGLGITVISSWLFVVSSSWVTLNWGIGQTFIAGIMVPMALHAADFTVYAKLAFAGNIKPTTLDVVRASLEVCLFVAPVLIIAAWIGAKTVSLAFFGLVTISSILAIVNLGLLLSALKVTWLQGVMMTIGYLLITVGYFLQNEQTMG